jgi:aspartate carbamoyltransferase catalytic subunit
VREYSVAYGLNARRAAALIDGALVMHPGPMNRGVEIADEVADLPRSVILRQVANGVAVRMAVLFMLLGTPQGKSPTGALASLGGALETSGV